MMNSRLFTAAACIGVALILAGCGSTSKRGGYYKDDGPGSDIPADILSTPDAVPRIEPYARANMRPYRVMGKTYVPLAGDTPYRETGIASWYGRKFHGRKTANGETYNMYAMTAAHPTLPLPSYARVTRPDTGASVVVRVNDRGPFHSGRVIDLSYTAAAKLGLIGRGSGKVVVEAITHTDIARAQSGGTGWATAGTSRQVVAQPVASAPAPVAVPVSQTPARQMTDSEPASTFEPEPVATPVPDALAVLEIAEGWLGMSTASASNESEPSSGTMPTLEEDVSTGIYLQFGAFSGQENAEFLAQRLNDQIAMVESRRAQVFPSSDLYRVRIGPFANRTEAVNAAFRIQQHTGAQATLATRD